MKKRRLIAILAAALCLLLAVPAMAADVFAFSEKKIEIYEGEQLETVLERDGKFAGDGDIVYNAGMPKILSVDEYGVLTGLKKGQSKLTASLKRDGKVIRKAETMVNVLRRVTKVTLNTTNLAVYEQGDEEIAHLLKLEREEPEETPIPEIWDPEATPEPTPEPEPDPLEECQVILLSAGSTVRLQTTCTPEDASNVKVNYETSDAGVAKILNGKQLQAVQRGQCVLTVASDQNPEITETFIVLVIQPVKKLTITGPSKNVAAGDLLQLDAVATPDNATIQEVTWSSRNPSIATVDDDGLVYGVKKGTVTIEATAVDGSKVKGVYQVNVTQKVTSIELKETSVVVSTGRTVQVHATLWPKEANDRSATWLSSDETVATVRNGVITGRKAGFCTVTCVSNSNPDVSETVEVQVVQPVTKIVFLNETGLSFPIRTSAQLVWRVEPEDASIKDVTFTSSAPKVATVDANGLVTGLTRGTATITATATDGSRKQGSFRVTVTQPVEGVEMAREIYYIQLHGAGNIKANVLPSNANNQNVYWSIEDDYYAEVRSNGTNTGRVHGLKTGNTTVTATTEDGGYTATADIKVGDFNGAVLIEDLEVDSRNNIKITLRNMSEIVLEEIYFRVDCYNLWLTPMICNTDGESTWFNGTYPLELYPREKSVNGQFNFGKADISDDLGEIVLTITGWKDSDGYVWTIPESERVTKEWLNRNYLSPTPAPDDGEEEEETNG